jgi:hypothetical protein
VGALAVFAREYFSSGDGKTYGHIAYVEDVNPGNGSFYISERNRSGKGDSTVVTYRWVSPSPKIHFIYGGRAGIGPGAGTGGRRIGVLDGSGTLSVKEGGLGAQWVTEATGVKEAVLSGNRIGVLDNGGTFSVKEGGLGASFVTESSGIAHGYLSGDRIGVLDGSGTLSVKEGGLGAQWVTEATGVKVGLLSQ